VFDVEEAAAVITAAFGTLGGGSRGGQNRNHQWSLHSLTEGNFEHFLIETSKLFAARADTKRQLARYAIGRVLCIAQAEHIRLEKRNDKLSESSCSL
jgi:hypothetical protein